MLNTVIIMGRMTADAEVRVTSNGTGVTRFTIAVERKYSKKGETKETDFINAVAWRNTAEFIERYFHKGDMIAIVGSLQVRKYEDKNGNNRYSTEVIVDEVSFCGSKNTTSTEPTFTVLSDENSFIDENDECPF